MNEETDAPEMGGSEAEAVADTSNEVETNSEATAEQPSGAEDAAQADDTGEATKRVPWFQKRIDEVTAKKYEAEREAAYWRGIAEASRGGQQVPVQQEPQGVPDRWEDPEGYDQWLISQAVSKFQQEQRQQTVLSTYEERAAKFRESKPDFESVVNNPSLRISPAMAELIRTSDSGPQVAYHLGTNPTEADRIAALPEVLQAKELGKLEAKLSVPQQAQPKPIPPAPPKTVQGLSAGVNKAPEDMSMAEYVAWRNNN